GAARVVCLEPEAAGSRENVRAVFRSTADALTCPQAEMQAVTFQDFDPAGGQFDVVMIHQAINHLDEEACILLHKEEEARRKYRKVLMKMAEVAAPGGRVIIVDVGRRNLFGDLGMRCPFARSIEWHKHQSPRLWLELLEEVGFRRRRVQWFSFNRLGRWGRIFLANALGAYVCGTSFCLVVDKP
ncbi:MAG TPA: hypothetical protein VLM89_03450, partial [Phycisphaerae bacterium]|nr:hypothetical protein [Phycisphaerae bacterium]